MKKSDLSVVGFIFFTVYSFVMLEFWDEQTSSKVTMAISIAGAFIVVGDFCGSISMTLKKSNYKMKLFDKMLRIYPRNDRSCNEDKSSNKLITNLERAEKILLTIGFFSLFIILAGNTPIEFTLVMEKRATIFAFGILLIGFLLHDFLEEEILKQIDNVDEEIAKLVEKIISNSVELENMKDLSESEQKTIKEVTNDRI